MKDTLIDSLQEETNRYSVLCGVGIGKMLCYVAVIM